MSTIVLSPNASGTGAFTLAAPNSNTNRTITLPDATGTVLTSATTTGFPAGSVLQVVSVSKTDQFTTTSTSMVDVTGLSATITPTSSNSKILVLVSLVVSGGITLVVSQFTQLLRGSTTIASWIVGAPATDQPGTLAYNLLDSPNTTSATTYKIQTRGDGALVGINARQNGNAQDVGDSSITLMEIAA